MLRHAFVSRPLIHGAGLCLFKLPLGHAGISSTHSNTHLARKRLIAACHTSFVRLKYCHEQNRTRPETQATKLLKSHKIAFSSHLYAYEENGGTKASARELNVAEHAVVKTWIFEDENTKLFAESDKPKISE